MKQKIFIHPSRSNVIVINYPGYNGDANGYNGKYKKIAEFIQEKGIGAVIRASNYPVDNMDYSQSVKDCLKEIIDYAMKNSNQICFSDTPRIYLMGISAGASAIAAVAYEYSEIEKILLIAPSGDAGLNSIENSLKNYIGELYIAIGANDEVVSSNTGKLFSSFAILAKVNKFMIVPNCDHQFRGEINGKILSKAPLWAFIGENTFPSPIDGIKLYD